MKKILVLPGDGIGAEIMPHVLRVLHAASAGEVALETTYRDVGGVAIDRHCSPLPEATLSEALESDAVLLGAVGGPKWDNLPVEKKPERGLLGLRSGLDCFANLRPAFTFTPLAHASSLKQELVAGLDILIVRELTGGIYFGQPRGEEVVDGNRRAFNTYAYDETEVRRIAKVAFDLARQRNHRVCSVDKANVLEVTAFWREIVERVHSEYEDVELTHMYVDNAAMQLVRNPKQFDVIVTGNMFGDILSDVAAMLTGSLGMLPSASLNGNAVGLYEPVHGTAPDIAGKGIANPLATILSGAMMFRYSLGTPQVSDRIERAIGRVLELGLRTPDIAHGTADQKVSVVGTGEMADAVISELEVTVTRP